MEERDNIGGILFRRKMGGEYFDTLVESLIVACNNG